MNCLNSILLTKSISNLNRSSELRDTLELHVSSTTSSETIAVLKLKIHKYACLTQIPSHKLFMLCILVDPSLKYILKTK